MEAENQAESASQLISAPQGGNNPVCTLPCVWTDGGQMTIIGSEDWPTSSIRCDNANPLVQDFFSYNFVSMTEGYVPGMLNEKCRMLIGSNTDSHQQDHILKLKGFIEAHAQNLLGTTTVRVYTDQAWKLKIGIGNDVDSQIDGEWCCAQKCNKFYYLQMTIQRLGQPQTVSNGDAGTITEPLLAATITEMTGKDDLVAHECCHQLWGDPTCEAKCGGKLWSNTDSDTCLALDAAVRKGVTDLRLYLAVTYPNGMPATATPTTTPTATHLPSPPGPNPDTNTEDCAAKWGKCGGQSWEGPTCCEEGAVCTFQSIWWSGCQ